MMRSVHFTEAGAALVAEEIDNTLGDRLVQNP